MKLSWKREMFAIAIVLTLVAISIQYYPILPDRMPSHFDAAGRVNAWMGKNEFFVLWAIVIVSIYLLVTFLPFIDPLRRKFEPRYKVMLLVRDIMLVIFGAMFLLSINIGMGGSAYVNWVGVVVGVLLIVLGNYMPKFPQNWFVGIKTPWTISSETVWKKTHIVGGWAFAAAGIVYIVASIMRLGGDVQLFVILLAAAIPIIYSFVLYKKLESAPSAPKS